MKEYLRNYFDNASKNCNFSGAVLVRKGNEDIFKHAYGYANRAFLVPNKTDTRFDTASITKIITAAAVIQLVEKGQLSLSDKITSVIDLEGTKIPNDVTIEQLLNHTSGIADDADEEAGEDYSALFRESPNYAIRECSDFLKNFAYKEPVFKAGTNVRYCNCAFVLLGLAIEKLTGMNYRDYVRCNVLKPAGMLNTDFLSMDGINENTAEGYTSVYDDNDNFTGYKKNIYCYPPTGTPDGGIYTTTEDLAAFITAIKENKLLGEEYSQLLLSPHCEFSHSDDWYEIPGMVERNGYALEFFLTDDEKDKFYLQRWL